MRDTVQVFYDSTNITDSVVSYDRDKAICTGVGAVRVEMKISAPITPQLYHVIRIVEDGITKGRFYIHTIDKTNSEGKLIISGQDGSLKLQDYFIAENYYVDYPSASDYWIKKFCDEATVDYSFDGVGAGSLLSNNTSMGMSSAMDAIVPLLQQNGWYLYFDADNVAHIGRVSASMGTYDATFNDNVILNIATNQHDKMFRNRILVWGNANPVRNTQVIAEIDRHGHYSNEYPGGRDIRSAVIANSNIKENGDAYNIASTAIKEFEQVSYEISVDVAGAWDVELGDMVFINSTWLSRGGMVTTVGSSMSDSGLVTHLVLNQRCPRLFAFYDIGGRIYIGTDADGVWRKPLDGPHVWENYSNGITDLNIVDLAVDNGLLACATYGGHGYLRSEAGAAWTRMYPTLVDTTSGLGTVTFPVESGMATTCAFDKTTGEAIVGFTLRTVNSGDPTRSWIYYASSPSNYAGHQLVDSEGETGYKIISIDNNGTSNLVSVVANYSGIVTMWNDLNHEGSYMLRNSDIYTQSGYVVDEISDGGTFGASVPHSYGLAGDGKYIYDMKSYYIRHFDDFITDSLIHVVEYNTNGNGATVASETFDNSYVDVDLAQSVGNRTIAFPYDHDGNVAFYQYNFKKGTHKNLTTFLGGLVIATYGVIHGGKRKLYTVVSDEVGPGYTIYYYDPDENVLHQAARGGVNSSMFGGTFSSMYKLCPRAYMLDDDNIAFLVGATYEDVEIEPDYFTNVDVPILIFYKLGSGIALTNNNIPAQLVSAGGMLALSDWVYTGGGGLETKAYVGLGFSKFVSEEEGTTWQGAVFECYKTGTVTTKYGPSENTPGSVAGNRERLYFSILAGPTTYQILNADTGLIIKSINLDVNDTQLIGQCDADSNNLYFYDYDSGDILSYPTSSSGILASGHSYGYRYNVNCPPNLDPPPGGFLWGVDRVDVGLVNDTFYGNVTSTFEVGGSTVAKHVIFSVLPPVSGARISPVDYTKWAHNDPMILSKQADNTYMTVLDTEIEYQIECSQPAPFAVFGGTSYSGIVISGQQTGWNQGKIYLSEGGVKGTFNSVILNGLHSHVSDLRTMYMLGTLSGEPTTGRFLLFPQPTEEVPQEGDTELVAIDISQLDPASNIISSGTLNQYGTVLKKFVGEYINHVETTNTPVIPYLFVSKSGIPAKFYQRDGTDSQDLVADFVERSTNLPDSNITCIRADDAI